MDPLVLSEQHWETIKSLGRFRRFPDQSWLTLQGSPDRTVFVIVEGEVRIVLAGTSGAELVVGVRGPGELVGEMAALDELPRSASIQAKGPVSVYTLTTERFFSFLAAHPEVNHRLLSTMAKRLRDLVQQHAMRSQSLAARIAWTLLTMKGEVGSNQILLTQQELAEWTGATREAAARVLTELRRQGLVSTGRGRITLLDPERLAAIS